MKMWTSLLCILFAIVIIIQGFFSTDYIQGFNLGSFGKIPAFEHGRVKPLDSIARQALLKMSGKQTLRLPEGEKMTATAWLLEVGFRPEVADTIPVFRIDNDEVLGLLGRQVTHQKYYSFNELENYLKKINEQALALSPAQESRTVFENQLLHLHESLTLYHELLHSFRPLTHSTDLLQQEYAAWLALRGPGFEAVKNQQMNLPYNAELMKHFIALADRYLVLSKVSKLGIIPPDMEIVIPPTSSFTSTSPLNQSTNTNTAWLNVGQSLLDSMQTGSIHPIVYDYLKLSEAYEKNNPQAFNATLKELQSRLTGHYDKTRLEFEYFFNQYEPFYRSLTLYIVAFLLVVLSWLHARLYFLKKPAFLILILAFLVHTLGLIGRIYIMQRPPVTNLYASAIFVGWVAVGLGLLLEKIFKRGIGTAVAGIVGFATLIIAHNLAASGDSLEMVRAVLDSNFWLSTHVVVVTMGYSAMFLAGSLGTIALIRNTFGNLDNTEQKIFENMVYGVINFALLFSFIGTMLGGIWADQSWGRFWGWDPKENGALLIVLWNAIVLHARLARWIQSRGLFVMAVAGNIVTSWSWFGTNMLGVGLHSYGFMTQAFWALLTFIISQCLIMLLGFFKRKENF